MALYLLNRFFLGIKSNVMYFAGADQCTIVVRQGT